MTKGMWSNNTVETNIKGGDQIGVVNILNEYEIIVCNIFSSRLMHFK